MAFIEWSSELDTGIQVIDNQHQRIVEYINKLHHAQEHHTREEVANVLDELVDYTLSHFAFEESLMEDADYAFVNAHKRVHQLFVKRVGGYQQRFKLGEDIAEELMHTLQAWLINHIKNDDRDYADAVRHNVQHVDDKKAGWLKRSFGRVFG
ncbi:MAG: bacteriohemerythrin [Gammaproteobacteria bacterium]|nr:bacteriohemerythrin [Gammaproteobacteria bacterium]MCP5298535.1 bacteriohemerythrin [Chromatiaceae bacterium]